jgi:putative NADH-flavin reductase
MKSTYKVAVIGGGGRTGQHIVSQLIEKDFYLKLLLRNPATFPIISPRIEILKGDALDPLIVRELLSGCDAVISTVGQRKGEPLVASAVMRNMLNAIKNDPDFASKRLIVLAGLNVDTPLDKKGEETAKATQWMKETFPDIHEDRQKSYQLLAESNANWTMVRVPFIDFNGDLGRIVVDLEDCPGSKVSAANIAQFMIGQLTDDTFVGKAPFIAG